MVHHQDINEEYFYYQIKLDCGLIQYLKLEEGQLVLLYMKVVEHHLKQFFFTYILKCETFKGL